MDKKTSDRKATSNFLTQKLATPVWLLTAVAAALILAEALKITIPNLLLALIAIILIVIGLLPSQKRLTTEAIKELSDPDSSGHKITVSNFPNYANPTLLKIENRDKLLDSKLDAGIGKITSIAGDLVFEVNNFASPVSLIVNYTPEDEQALIYRREYLTQKGLLPVNDEIKLIPVYLQSQIQEEGKPASRIWKPFENFDIDKDKREITIQVSSWGDQPIGFGTKP